MTSKWNTFSIFVSQGKLPGVDQKPLASKDAPFDDLRNKVSYLDICNSVDVVSSGNKIGKARSFIFILHRVFYHVEV